MRMPSAFRRSRPGHRRDPVSAMPGKFGVPTMLKRMAIMLISTGLIFGAIFGFQVFKAKMIAQAMAAE